MSHLPASLPPDDSAMPPNNAAVLRELFAAIYDETATDKQVRAFEESLRCDARAADYFARYVQMRILLQQKFAIKNESQSPPKPPPPIPSLLDAFSDAWQNTVVYFEDHPMNLSYLVATVIFAIAGIVASHVYVTNHQPTQKIVESGSSQAPSNLDREMPTAIREQLPSESRPTPVAVGRIANVVDCEWSRAAGDEGRRKPISNLKSPIPNAQSLVALGDKFILASGLMEIVYDTGAHVILDGPCAYTVDSPSGGFLSIGKLTAKLEKDLKSQIANQQTSNPQSQIPNPLFAVRTPTATVTDLGTEFGVEVDKAGLTQSHVFRGKVVFIAMNDGKPSGKGVTLGENESAHVEKNSGQSGWQAAAVRLADAHPSAFVRVLPQPRLEQESRDYAELVLSMRPTVYYRMESPKNENAVKEEKDRYVLFDSAPGGHHGVIHFTDEYIATTPYSQGRFGESIRLRGPMTKDYAIVPDYPEATGGRLTVSVWVKVLGRASLATLAADRFVNVSYSPSDDHAYRQFILYLHPDNAGGDLAARMVQPNGKVLVIREGRSELFPLGTWQHVVLVIDKTTMDLYRNGRKVATSPCGGLPLKPPKGYLIVGSKGLSGDVDTGAPGHWPGFVDELAIFNRALSAKEIERLYGGKASFKNSESD